MSLSCRSAAEEARPLPFIEKITTERQPPRMVAELREERVDDDLEGLSISCAAIPGGLHCRWPACPGAIRTGRGLPRRLD
jgi:hypothetical protein